MTTPSFDDQLLSLPPMGKIIAGAVLGVGGTVACVVLWERGWIAWIAVFAAIFGPALVLDVHLSSARRNPEGFQKCTKVGSAGLDDGSVRAPFNPGRRASRLTSLGGCRQEIHIWII